MHPTAWLACHLFFTILNDFMPFNEKSIEILDVGSYDVNGNLRECIELSPFSRRNYVYTGTDIAEGPNVDLVAQSWPFDNHLNNSKFDIIISSSCLEHDDFFWDTFLNMAKTLKPEGFLYINVPSVSIVHRHPVDNWRFFSGAAQAFAQYANMHSLPISVIHSSSLPYRSQQSNFDLVHQDTIMIFHKKKETENNKETLEALSLSFFKYYKQQLILRIRRFHNQISNTPYIKEHNSLSSESNAQTLIEMIPFSDEELKGLELYVSKEPELFIRYNLPDQFYKDIGCLAGVMRLELRHKMKSFSDGFPLAHQSDMGNMLAFNLSLQLFTCKFYPILLIPKNYTEFQLKELLNEFRIAYEINDDLKVVLDLIMPSLKTR